MTVELVTGYSGTDSSGEPNRHVSSADDGARQAGTVGSGMYVLETGSKMSATMEDANTLVVSDGDALINGRHVRIPDTLSFTIPTGVQARKVSNLAVLRYSVGSNSVETVEPVVLTGEPSSGTPTDPAYNTGSILDGDSPVDMPLYRVVTDGVNALDPVPLFGEVLSLDGVRGYIDGRMAASSASGSMNDGWTVDNFALTKVDGTVTCAFNASFLAGSAFAGVYGSVPAGFRPAASLRVPATMASATAVHAGYVEFRADGSVYINSGGATVIQAIACATWRAA